MSHLDSTRLGTLQTIALSALRQKSPYQWPAYVTTPEGSAQPARSPASLFPAFHAAYDWHSCVHGHWCLVRLLRVAPDLRESDDARRHLAANLTAERLAGEVATLSQPEYGSFERPYGLAWACLLAAELEAWEAPQAKDLARQVAPLAELAASRIMAWHKRLPYPIQSGEHSQSAFGLGFLRDWADALGRTSLVREIDAEVMRLYGAPSHSFLRAEPSGHDFLSPSLARAELVGRVLPAVEFARWLRDFYPDLGPGPAASGWLTPAQGHDASDGKLAHLIGLNLSRSWMLRRIAESLPPADALRSTLTEVAVDHARQGLDAVSSVHFESSHWLATFAVYAATKF